MLFNTVLFIAVLSVLILTHEFGHFIAAKKMGVKVIEFAFGFPPRIISRKKGETVYSLNALPLGGYVKMEGEDGVSRGPRSFAGKSIGARAIIIIAGVGMNIITAFVLFTFVHMIGSMTIVDPDMPDKNDIENISVQVVQIAPGSPADMAGLKFGDSLVSLSYGGESIQVSNMDQVSDFIALHAGEEVQVLVRRGKEEKTIGVVPRINPPEGEGATGIAMQITGLKKVKWYIAPIKGLESTYYSFVAIFKFFGKLISSLFGGPSVPGVVAGPVGIATIIADSGRLGLSYLLQIVAIISVNLAIINILPIPALDGGHIVFLVAEKIKGSPLNPKIPMIAHSIGFALLVGLLIYVTYWDIVRFF